MSGREYQPAQLFYSNHYKGETYGQIIEQAIMEACLEWNTKIPAPGPSGTSRRFVTRVSRILHARLTARAKQEGVSLNTLFVISFAEFTFGNRCSSFLLL